MASTPAGPFERCAPESASGCSPAAAAVGSQAEPKLGKRQLTPAEAAFAEAFAMPLQQLPKRKASGFRRWRQHRRSCSGRNPR
jgi:hypothetical protein